ncbi:hypothetical protein ACFU76_04615 [Streptomyces sp. NPDC057539]|uniref:hypothetical protein n=1 Tax=Streptomyces sp. NPDC057539 TaxID=3346159 RepID=UPI0036B28109
MGLLKKTADSAAIAIFRAGRATGGETGARIANRITAATLGQRFEKCANTPCNDASHEH